MKTAMLVAGLFAASLANGEGDCFEDAGLHLSVHPAPFAEINGLTTPEDVAWLDQEAALEYLQGRLIDAGVMAVEAPQPDWLKHTPQSQSIDNLMFLLGPQLQIRFTYLPSYDEPVLGRVHTGFVEFFFVERLARPKDGKCDASVGATLTAPTGGASTAYWGTSTQVVELVDGLLEEIADRFLAWGAENLGQCSVNGSQQ